MKRRRAAGSAISDAAPARVSASRTRSVFSSSTVLATALARIAPVRPGGPGLPVDDRRMSGFHPGTKETALESSLWLKDYGAGEARRRSGRRASPAGVL